jgi:hypothetical protein
MFYLFAPKDPAFAVGYPPALLVPHRITAVGHVRDNYSTKEANKAKRTQPLRNTNSNRKSRDEERTNGSMDA